MHQHFADASVNRQVSQDHVLSGVIIPNVTRHDLVMPCVFTSRRLNSQNGGQKPIVTASGTSVFLNPFHAIGSAEVDKVETRVIGDRAPYSSTTPGFPPLAMPGLRRFLQNWGFERLGGITRDRVETPVEAPGFRVVGRN